MSLHAVHVPTREEVLAGTARPVSKKIKTICTLFALLGTAVFLVGAFIGQPRVWHALLYNWLYFAGVSSAAVAFVAATRIVTARWSRPVIRFLEGYVAFLPVAFVLLAIIVLVGKGHIFPWVHEAPLTPEKAAYLNPTFFTIRTLVTFGIITALSLWLVYTSVRLDVGQTTESDNSVGKWARGLRERMRRGFRDERREIHSTHALQGKLAVFLAFAWGFGWIILAWDLSMSLDLHFQSTLYGWWVFMGSWVAALASWTLITMAWRKYLGRYDLITETHFHDFGKLCFAFTAFWGYLTFGQYLVIWYGNMGEETHWMRLRLIQPWEHLTIVVVFLMFVFPFFGLLSKAAKVYLPTMTFFALCTVVGLWLHRYDEVYPSIYGVVSNIPFGIWEIGVTMGLLGIWGLCYISFMDAFPRMRATLLTSPYRDEVQLPVNPETMEPIPAHE